MKRKLLFIDRDGTLIAEPADEQIDAFEKLVFLPGVFYHLGRIARAGDFDLILVTNQDGLGTDSFPEKTFWPVQELMMNTLAGEGIHFKNVHIDASFAHDPKPSRKPGTAMLTAYMNDLYDMENSYTIGDRLTDVQLAQNLGCKSLFLRTGKDKDITFAEDVMPAAIVDSWKELADFVLRQDRIGHVRRTTKETDIDIRLNLDGNGKGKVHTGLQFLDHMLDQLARHGQVDLDIEVKGDLHVDEHHTMEDTAIALGEAFKQALGTKKGIMRYGFLLPMDDCLAQVAIDFGGRPWLVWEAEFKRERIGDTPTELFFHFFKSFSDAAACNLNVKAEGDNEHHKIESIFKAWAKAIAMAIKRDTDNPAIPSTKGSI
jgi:imidazoleglycerol-phosphate dehydratase/histidinol-phosphatase